MQVQQEKCVPIDEPLCDQCHEAKGSAFLLGQWLCRWCREDALDTLTLERIKC